MTLDLSTIGSQLAKNGCLFMSELFASKKLDKLFPQYVQCVSLGLLTEDCYVIDHEKLASHLGMQFVCSSKYPSSDPSCINIACFETERGGTHFCVVSPEGHILYDNLSGLHSPLRDVLSYRIFKLEEV